MRRNARDDRRDLDEFRIDAVDRNAAVLDGGGVAVGGDGDLQA